MFRKLEIKPKDLKIQEKETVSDIMNDEEQLIKTKEYYAIKNIKNEKVLITFLEIQFETSLKETCSNISKELKWISKNVNSLKKYFAKDSKDIFGYLTNKDQSIFTEETILNSIVINNINFIDFNFYEVSFGAPSIIKDNLIGLFVDQKLKEELKEKCWLTQG